MAFEDITVTLRPIKFAFLVNPCSGKCWTAQIASAFSCGVGCDS